MAEITRQKNRKKIERIYQLFGTHKQIVIANFTNVSSTQVHQIRKALRSYGAQFVINKNTLTKKIINMRAQGIQEDQFKYLQQQFGGKIPQLKVLIPLLKDKIALIFTDASVFQLKAKLQGNKVPREAKVGVPAPIDYTVQACLTGLQPSQINFFHALNISTKINKTQIQITKDFKVCTAGKKIKASQAALLKKLNLKPFSYGLNLTHVYDDGCILPQEMLNFDPSNLLDKIQNGIQNITALSLSTGYLIQSTIPLVIANGFRNIAALSLQSGFKIPELDSLGPAPSKDSAKQQPAGKEKKPEKQDKQDKQDKPQKQSKKQTKPQIKPQPPKQPQPADDEGMDMGGLFD